MAKFDLVFCTSNEKKVKDLVASLGDDFNVIQYPIDLLEIQGDPVSISTFKAEEAYKVLKKPLIVEDTCLGFNAFNGLPGPYIKFFLNELGTRKLPRLLDGFEDKTGFAMCTFAYIDEQGVKVFQHKVEGHIVEPRGNEDFGWNSIFQPLGYDKTYAEMPFEVRNTLNHRCYAAKKLREFLLSAKFKAA